MRHIKPWAIVLALLLLSSCGMSESDVNLTESSQSANNLSENTMPPPKKAFKEKFLFDTFEQLSTEFKQQGVDRFVSKAADCDPTEQQIEERRQEVSDVFSEFTYIPYYDGKQGVIDCGLYVEIPSDVIKSFEANSYTAFEYVVAFETADGFNKNYAYVYVAHDKERKDHLWRSWINGEFEVLEDQIKIGQTELGGKTIQYAVGNNLTYFFDYDEDVLIVISFRLKEALSEEIVKSQYPDWGLSAELEDRSWLSKLSFQKIDFTSEFQLEYFLTRIRVDIKVCSCTHQL